MVGRCVVGVRECGGSAIGWVAWGDEKAVCKVEIL